MRVRSSAASASESSARAAGQRSFQPRLRRRCRPPWPCAGRCAPDPGGPSPGSRHRAPCRHRHRPCPRCAAPLSTRSSSSRASDSGRSALAKLSSAVLRSCAALADGLVVAIALADRDLGARRMHARDQILVGEPHHEVAGRDLVVDADQHLGDAARRLRGDADLAAQRLDAAGRRRRPCRLGCAARPSASRRLAALGDFWLKVCGT